MSSRELPKAYTPSVEEAWYARWEKAGHFHVDASDPRPAFTIVIPPPNVTGSLHMGHALNNTLQDIMARYKRMDQFAVLWLPGTDHAGIATQNVVEKQLAKENMTRHDLGREVFVEKVWAWKETYGGKIFHQLRRLGASCDWSRERFTMDEGLSRAVREVFVQLYNEGLIYRSSYLISWCPRCLTALSDLEVKHTDTDGRLTYFTYKTTDGENLTVATTRPETMLGDSGVAVHPGDKRYKAFVGKEIRHPFLPRTFPVIADSFVDPKFGTGAVKVTPAHDPNDYEMGKRHDLEFITVLDKSGAMAENTGSYAGLDRFKARKKIVEDLKAQGLVEKIEDHKHAVGHCDRCNTVVEPRVSEQWFVKVEGLAKPAIEAVKNGDMAFVPENWTKTYLNWMENIRDWCISRQLWWGHQVPVWYCGSCNERTVTVETPTKCTHCGSEDLTQDSDVLDTWFSSGLWPFSTMGWPDQTADLKKFYPTTMLFTGFDIIFFWVARMMMMGLKFMGKVPFQTVHIHALVKDEKGKKMSKSKGNVVDPLDIMDKYGTDAFRFSLAAFSVQGRDISLSEKRIEGYRNFINKLWNASRFALSMADNAGDPTPQTLPDQWIRHRLGEVTKAVRTHLDALKFSDAADLLYRFVWHEFCDWYLEMIKPHKEKSSGTLLYTLDLTLRLLHPMIPFVTEEIWQKLPIDHEAESIMLATYPKDDGFRSESSMKDFLNIQGVIDAVRNIRSENRIPPSKEISVQIKNGKVLKPHAMYIETLARLSDLELSAKTFPKNAAIGVSGDFEIAVPLDGLVDLSSEKDRLEKEHKKALEDQEFLKRRLSNENFKKNAPANVVAQDEQKLKDATAKLEKLDQALSKLGK